MNSTRAAGPFGGPCSSNRIQMLRFAAVSNSKSSNGRKIARMAQNLTIFGPNRSRRRELNFGNFRIFRNLFVRFVLSKIFQRISCAETIRLVRKSSKSELSSRFFGRLKIFIGWGSLYSLELVFQTPHYAPDVSKTWVLPPLANCESQLLGRPIVTPQNKTNKKSCN